MAASSPLKGALIRALLKESEMNGVFEIGIADEFEAAHSLRGDFGPATRVHGHTYKVEVRIEGREIDGSATLYDLGRLKTDLRAVLGEMHYRNLNDLPSLGGVNTTAESVARHIFDRLAPSLRTSRLIGMRVTVWESSSAFASYRESFEKPGHE